MKPYVTTSTAKKRVSDLPGCGACGRFKDAKSPKMKPSGEGKKSILIIGEAPGSNDDAKGTQFTGDSGKILRSVMVELGIELKKDCILTNACCCFSDKGSPEPEEVEYCRSNILATIKKYNPKLIILLGGAPLRSLYGHRCKFDMSIMTWRGAVIPDYELGAFVVPTYNPSYLLRVADAENGDVVRTQFKEDIQRGLKVIRKETNLLDYASLARKHCSLPSDAEAVRMMRDILEVAHRSTPHEEPICAFDYETSGLKPDADGHSIYVASIASSTTGNCFSFFINDNTRDTFIEFLKCKKIRKLAHNHKHEERWSRKILDTRVQGWLDDGMLVQHCIDNRTGVTGLKFQVAIRYGDLDYSRASGLFGSDDQFKDSNSVNSYDRYDQNALRLYNALDSIYELWLYRDQVREIKKINETFGKHPLLRGQAATFREGLDLMMDTTKTFTAMEINGMPIDMGYLHSCDGVLGKLIYEAREEFLKTKVAKEWQKRFGVINVNSSKQLKKVLYTYLGFEPPKQTENEDDATDKEALLTLNDPELIKLIDLRKLMKARGTYVKQINREVVKGVIHPSFSLNIARTFRSSCQNPNLQNIPIRDKLIGKIIRTMFIPRSPDDCIVEVDLKGAEVCVAACYNQDPKLISYVEDQTLDMHRDMAERLFLVKREDITKEIRYCGKNMFVFPEFYGSYAGNCAKALWHASGNLFVGPQKIPMRKWLSSRGINSQTDFEQHVEAVESYFWEDMFSVYTEWKEEWWQSYLDQGFVDTFTGFRCSMLMDRRKAINYPIQGDAFHVEAWIANQVRQKLRFYKGDMKKAKLMNLIHDSLIASVPASCLNEFIKLVLDTVADTRNKFAWINVPINAEVEVAPVGMSWIEKKPFVLENVA